MSAQATVSPASILAFQPTTLNEVLAKLEHAIRFNKQLVHAAKASGYSAVKRVAQRNLWSKMTKAETIEHAIKRCHKKSERIMEIMRIDGIPEFIDDAVVATVEEEEQLLKAEAAEWELFSDDE